MPKRGVRVDIGALWAVAVKVALSAVAKGADDGDGIGQLVQRQHAARVDRKHGRLARSLACECPRLYR